MKVGSKIREIADQKGMSIREIADEAKLSYNTVYSIIKRDSARVELETVGKIAGALGVPVLELLREGDNKLPEDLSGDNVPQALKAAYMGIEEMKNLSIASFRMWEMSRKEKYGALEDAYDKLNETGKQIAIERVLELTKIPDYQKEE